MYGSDYVFDGKADLLRGNGDTSDQVTIIATGIGVHDAIAVSDALKDLPNPIQVRVFNVSCIRPLDSSAILQAALETGHLVVVEDHNVEGGLATQVADIIADFSVPCTLRRLGASHYFPSAKSDELKLFAGLDTESIVDACEDEVRAEVYGGEDAFVTAVSELTHNLQHSRFKETASEFANKLLTEKGYLEKLREYWGERTCSTEELPSNEELINRLKQAT